MRASIPGNSALAFLTVLIALLSANQAICSSISGKVTYLNNTETPLAGITVYLKDINGMVHGTRITSITGEYNFDIYAEGYYYVTASSTANTGGINALDALLTAKYFVGLGQLTGLNFKAGDVDTSSFINANDALLIQHRFVQLISTFPAGDWVFEEKLTYLNLGDDIILDLKGLCYGDVNGSYLPPVCEPLPTKANAGPNQNVNDTLTNLAANSPETGSGTWIIVNGPGGIIADSTDPLSSFTGIPGIPYTLLWAISTQCATSSDKTVITLHIPTFVCGNTFTDIRDNQSYPTVQIGTQCWMQKNLNYGSMITGGSPQTNNGVVEKYCFANDQANCAIYGGFYQWTEAMNYQISSGTQGICPTGFHIPTTSEWCTLTTFVDPTVSCTPWINWTGTTIGMNLRESGNTHWYPGYNGDNSSGFTALGAGYWSGNFYGLTSDAYFSTSSTSVDYNNQTDIWSITIYNAKISHITAPQNGFSSLRCIHD